jgi:hypothetical protein
MTATHAGAAKSSIHQSRTATATSGSIYESFTWVGKLGYRYRLKIGVPRSLRVPSRLGNPGEAIVSAPARTFPVVVENVTPNRPAPLFPESIGGIRINALYQVPASVALHAFPNVWSYTLASKKVWLIGVGPWYSTGPSGDLYPQMLAQGGRIALTQSTATYTSTVREGNLGLVQRLLAREKPMFVFVTIDSALDDWGSPDCPADVILDGSGKVFVIDRSEHTANGGRGPSACLRFEYK